MQLQSSGVKKILNVVVRITTPYKLLKRKKVSNELVLHSHSLRHCV